MVAYHDFITRIAEDRRELLHRQVFRDWLIEQQYEEAGWVQRYLEMQSSWDWMEAFGFAGHPGTAASRPSIYHADVFPSVFSLEPFTLWDVLGILAEAAGEPDGPPWRCYGVLLDRRWFYLEAGCRYSGWAAGCGGSVGLASTRGECERLALTEQARHLWGIT